jgi:hypothetical protein
MKHRHVSKKHKLIFLLPPKTGSTSLSDCLHKLKIQFDSIMDTWNYSNYIHPTIMSKTEHNPFIDTTRHLLLSEILKAYDIKIEELDKYKIVQIIRNPYDRFVSAVYHQNIILNKNYTVSEYLEKLNKSLYLLPNNQKLFYEKFYETPPDEDNNFLNHRWGGCMRHWFKQEWWNDIGANVNYFKLESITENLEELSEFIDIKLSNFPHLRPGNSNRNNKYEKYFDETARINFEKLYISDIEKFNYEFYNPLSKNLI